MLKVTFSEYQVSIHAPARGATNVAKHDVDNKKFQSTLLHEERPAAKRVLPFFLGFNPRSCTRSDRTYTFKIAGRAGFQSTLLHEERPTVMSG